MSGSEASHVERAREALSRFIELNPYSSVEPIEAPKACVAVRRPWGEETMIIEASPDNTALCDALNSLRLPERYSGLWHSDTSRFEIIWTAFKLPERIRDINGRSFEFRHAGVDYRCSFGHSSDRLLAIAEKLLPIGASATNHRNMQSFSNYMFWKDERAIPMSELVGSPLSFWIDGLTWDDDLILDVVKHLNFYMVYFDNTSPRVLVHSPAAESTVTKPQTRFKSGGFPARIAASPLDDNLLHLWDATLDGDSIRRFLYNYQIVEYAAFYYVDESVKRAIRRVLVSPNSGQDLDRALQQIVEAIGESRTQEHHKIQHLLKGVVDPNSIWAEIENNIGAFTQKTFFDGGFAIEPMVKASWGLADFATNWIPTFLSSLERQRL